MTAADKKLWEELYVACVAAYFSGEYGIIVAGTLKEKQMDEAIDRITAFVDRCLQRRTYQTNEDTRGQGQDPEEDSPEA